MGRREDCAIGTTWDDVGTTWDDVGTKGRRYRDDAGTTRDDASPATGPNGTDPTPEKRHEKTHTTIATHRAPCRRSGSRPCFRIRRLPPTPVRARNGVGTRAGAPVPKRHSCRIGATCAAGPRTGIPGAGTNLCNVEPRDPGPPSPVRAKDI